MSIGNLSTFTPPVFIDLMGFMFEAKPTFLMYTSLSALQPFGVVVCLIFALHVCPSVVLERTDGDLTWREREESNVANSVLLFILVVVIMIFGDMWDMYVCMNVTSYHLLLYVLFLFFGVVI